MSNLLCSLLRRWLIVKPASCKGRGPTSHLHPLPLQGNHNGQFVRLMEIPPEVSQHSTRSDAVGLQTHSTTKKKKEDCFSKAPVMRARKANGFIPLPLSTRAKRAQLLHPVCHFHLPNPRALSRWGALEGQKKRR